MKNGLIFLMLLSIGFCNGQNKEIRLYSGAAPGSETWNWDEKQSVKNIFNARIALEVENAFRGEAQELSDLIVAGLPLKNGSTPAVIHAATSGKGVVPLSTAAITLVCVSR